MSIFNSVANNIKTSPPNNNTLTKHGDGFNSAYGSKWFDSNTDDVYSLNIKINKMANYIFFGMVTDKHHQDTNTHFHCNQHSIDVDLCDGEVDVNGQSIGYRGPQCKSGDIIRVTFDCKKKTLHLLKNNDPKQYQLAKFTEIENGKHIKFRMALTMIQDKDSVTFECVDSDKIGDDFKEKESSFELERKTLQSLNEELNNKIYSLQKQQNESKKKIDELTAENEMITKQQNENKEKEKSLNEMNDKYEQKMNEMAIKHQEKINDYDVKLKKKLQEIKALTQKNTNIQQKVTKKEEEITKLESTIKRSKEEIKSITASFDEYKKENESLIKKEQENKHKMEALTQKLEELSDLNVKHEQEMNEMQAEYKKMEMKQQEKDTKKEEEITKLESTIKTSEQEIERLREQNKRDIKEYEKEKQSLKQQISEQKNKINPIKKESQLAEHHNLATQINDNLEEEKEEKINYKSMIDELKAEKMRLEQEIKWNEKMNDKQEIMIQRQTKEMDELRVDVRSQNQFVQKVINDNDLKEYQERFDNLYDKMREKEDKYIEENKALQLEMIEIKNNQNEIEQDDGSMDETDNPFERYISYFAVKYPMEASIFSYYAMIVFVTAMVFSGDKECDSTDIIISWFTFCLFIAIPLIVAIYKYILNNNNNNNNNNDGESVWMLAIKACIKLVVMGVLMLTADLRPFACYIDDGIGLQIGVIVFGTFAFLLHSILTKINEEQSVDLQQEEEEEEDNKNKKSVTDPADSNHQLNP